ncbi:MAG: hypothetical protein HC896_12835 [Bacteroidales bacterium]|nr:hypothetical protein [Bacteroidales bacterium]
MVPIIHDNSAYANTGYSFNVHVPFLLSQANDLRLKSLINTYKLASKKYKILYG